MSLLFTSMEAFLKEPATLHPDTRALLHRAIDDLSDERVIEIQELFANTDETFEDIIDRGYRVILDHFIADMDEAMKGA